jgi:hypothetical protein
MSTIIRHKPTQFGFAVVVTSFADGFTAHYQLYSEQSCGMTYLEDQRTFTTERDAIEVFDKEGTVEGRGR